MLQSLTEQLSRRELEVALLVARGLPNKEVARKLERHHQSSRAHNFQKAGHHKPVQPLAFESRFDGAGTRKGCHWLNGRPIKAKEMPINDLIYDVGMNNGDDTAYYLSLGFRTVAIEANPESVKYAKGALRP